MNRYWKHFLGRGLVEPEDDIRVSNPPSNPELLDALADDFVRERLRPETPGPDHRHQPGLRPVEPAHPFERGRSPQLRPVLRPAAAGRGPARCGRRGHRLPREVRRPARGQFLATQLPDDGFVSYFLDVFGRPKRESVCECERSTEANLSQTLHLLNSDDVNGKLTPETARAARLAADPRPEADQGRAALSPGARPRADRRSSAECVAFLEKRKVRPARPDRAMKT